MLCGALAVGAAPLDAQRASLDVQRTPLAAPRTLPDSLRTRVDAVFSMWDRSNTPGCALGISEQGKVVYERGYGISDLQHALAITPQSIFHVASISKQFTAYAVAMLAQDGKLSLDDSVRKFIPELPSYGTPITVRQLMHHTSGLRDQWQLLGYAGWRFPEDLITERDVLNIVTRQRGLNFTPQSEWVYSNTGFTLLAVIVRRVSGQSLRDFAQQRIFDPLGMTRTHFHDDHTMIVPGRTSAYDRRPGGGWRIWLPVFDTYGATSLFSTTGDLLTWMANLDQPTVGNAALVADAQKSAVLSDGTPANYGYGLSLGTYRGLTVIGHGGADAGYRAQIERYPTRGLGVAVLCNASSAVPSALARRVADVMLGTSVPAEASFMDSSRFTATPALLARWEGVYRDSVSQSLLRVRRTGDTLRLSDGRRLTPTSDTTLRIAGGNGMLVLRAEKGQVTGVRQLPRGLRDAVLRRETSVTPSAALLAQYVGSYYSEELDVRYALVANDSVLALKHRKFNGNALLRPEFVDGFSSSMGATILFTRDAKKRITGFTLSDGRVRGVRFEREAEKR
jgi:CubicO group peptidase (beta-lactamase class C family)